MVQKNGYFTIEFTDEKNGICHVYPANEGGERVQYRELISFLDMHGFSYDVREVNRCIFSAEPIDFKFTCLNNIDFADSMVVDVSSDKMTATARFYKGSPNGPKITVKDIMGGLKMKNVIFGIDQESIIDFLNNPVYSTDVVLAKGLKAEEGHDAYIEYYFNTNPNMKPAYNPDGTVDFHSLEVISQVSEGQLLAKLFKEDKGKTGRNVLNQESAPRPVKPTFLKAGRNIKLSEDGCEAYSEVTGHATLINGQIFVSDVYEVPADVDNSTGDINYNGNVHIVGSVRDGFQVSAKGDVIIDGTVEGALVMAGGQIVIKRGVNGMNKGVLQADGNIISKFIENAKVFSNGYIDTGSIIHSTVTAKGDVVVKDKKGFITGSVVKSGGMVEACTIGSNMGSTTTIEIGVDPQVKAQYSELDKEIRRINAENQKLVPIIQNYNNQIKAGVALDPKNKEYYIKIRNALAQNKETLDKDVEKFQILKTELERSTGSKVVVSKDIFPGVTVICSDVSLTIKEKRSYCFLEKKDGEIVIQNL